MSLFKKLLGTNKNITNISIEDNLPDRPKFVPAKVKRTIFDFFRTDLRNLPDDSFVKAEVETNTTGDSIENYRKSLNYKECGIFDTIEIKLIGSSSKNIFLKSFQPESVKMDNLKKLIDELYLIHGNDSMDKGKFTSKDIEDYLSNDFYMLFGRSWMDYPKYKFPVSVARDEDEISISIWGVGNGD